MYSKDLCWGHYFLMYANDIEIVVSGEKVELFAGDSNLFIFGLTINMLNYRANYCIRLLHQWFVAYKLTSNLTRTYYVTSPMKNLKELKIAI